jgi:ribonuclease VapC
MTKQVVLDASALIAFVGEEQGADQVETVIRAATVSAVNWAEVLQRADRAGADATLAADTLKGLGVRIEPSGEDDAVRAARLQRDNPALSLGDRFCLALAQRLEQPAYTADPAWKKAVTTAKVVLIR